MAIIYETTGRAREYFPLAANLYSGCGHGCRYCFGADVLRVKQSEFFDNPKVRDNVLFQLQKDAVNLRMMNEKRHVLLSFVTDPYQPLEMELEITRQAIEILHSCGLSAAILTKGGNRALRDFDILTHDDLFGVTLVFDDEDQRRIWEPDAAPTEERIETLRLAHEQFIKTWVSFEPVFYPEQTLSLIRKVAGFVDVFKVGTLNYQEQAKFIDWKKFAVDAVELLDELGVNYYIKKDLAKFIGQHNGIRKGDLPV